MGRPSLRRLSREARMASLAIPRASSRVSPSVTSPGSAGQVTTNPPSSAGSNSTVYAISSIDYSISPLLPPAQPQRPDLGRSAVRLRGKAQWRFRGGRSWQPGFGAGGLVTDFALPVLTPNAVTFLLGFALVAPVGAVAALGA